MNALVTSEKKRASDRRWRAANPEKVRAQARNWVDTHPEQRRESARKWQAANPEKVRATKLKRIEENRKYSREYRRKLMGFPLPTRPMPEFCEANCGRKAQCLDHCHITNKFRGWLCNGCNRGLGLIGDRVENLNNLVNYMQKVEL